MKKQTKLHEWNILDSLDSEEAIAAYLEAALEENDTKFLIIAIGDIVRARGINLIAKKMEVNRESLYKSLSGNTKPNFETIVKAIDALGLKMRFAPKERIAQAG